MFNEILNTLYTIDHFPTCPALKNIILNTAGSADCKDKKSLAGLAHHISFDPSMFIEFLKIANADSFGYRKKISSVNNALLILDDELINLIISQHPLMPEIPSYQALFRDYMLIIKHTIEVRIILQNLLDGVLINATADENERDELIAASVIHDIGLLFLLLYFPDEYRKSVSHNESNPAGNAAVPDHAFIGSILCEYWHLPYSIRVSTAFHHYPWLADEKIRKGAEMLYIADSLSSTFYDIFYSEDDVYSLEEHIVMKKQLLDIVEKYGIEMMDIALIREESLLHTEKIMDDIGFSYPAA